LAPALNDPAISEQSPDTLERILLNGVPGTLMASWQNSLSDEDTDALITLLTQWDQVHSGTIPAPDRQVAVTEESLELGAELYSTNCARCHGPEGQGTPRAPSLNVKGFLTETNDIAIQQIVTLGVPGTAMPAWGDRMTDADIQAIVGFMRAWEPFAPEVAEPARGGGSAWWSAESGTGSRGKGGGPPWMRNTNSGAPDGQSLPSGGASQSNSGNPEMDGVEAQQAGVSPNAPQGSRNFGSKTQASPGSGSSANSALEGQGREAPSGQTNEVVGDQTHSGQQDGPPWVSQNQQPVSWWQEMDWRIVLFVAGGFLVAFSLIILSVLKLRKLEFEI
jgi:mono/diheme cytochrome c family protein